MRLIRQHSDTVTSILQEPYMPNGMSQKRPNNKRMRFPSYAINRTKNGTQPQSLAQISSLKPESRANSEHITSNAKKLSIGISIY